MAMLWENLPFSHRPVPANTIRVFLELGLELDLFGGHAWLGMVSFAGHYWPISNVFSPVAGSID